MKKLIIFDFDGVIIDSWEHSYKMNQRDWPGITPEEHRKLFSGNVFKEAAKKPPSQVSREEKKKWLEEVYYPAKLSLPIYEGIREVVLELSHKYKLVINSSAGEKSIDDILIRSGLKNCFEKIYGYETSKDKSEKFKMILDEYQLKPEECMLVTDTVGDVLEAEHHSIPSIVVTYGYQDRSYFNSIEEKVVGFANTPQEILHFIA